MAYKILVIDDEASICRIISAFLTKNGFHSMSAQSGEEALKILDKEKVDLLILDEKMPGVSGREVYWEIKKKGIDIPTIVITGSRTLAGYEKEAEKMGYADLLFKPVDLDILLEKIQSILANIK